MEHFVLIGNSTIKVYNKHLDIVSSYTHNDTDKCIQELNLASEIFLASVVPSITEHLKNSLKSKIKEIDHSSIKQINIKTDSPKDTGIDRILNGLASFDSKLLENNVIVDCGTAMSISVVTSNGDFLGGTISSGLSTENAALSQNTALLDDSGQVRHLNNSIGKNTLEAINNGILLGKIGAIKEIYQQIKTELTQINPHPTKLILTGGWADLISPNLKIAHKHETDLTIKGLHKAAAQYLRNAKNNR